MSGPPRREVRRAFFQNNRPGPADGEDGLDGAHQSHHPSVGRHHSGHQRKSKRTSMYIRRRTIYICISALLGALCASSCSIKEDRWPCPCWLVFHEDPESSIHPEGEFLVKVFPEGKAEEEKSITMEWKSLQDDSYEVSVSKGYKTINLISGISRSVLSVSDLIISPGCQADSIYSCVGTVACLGEEAVVPVRMGKQFASVFLRMENDSDSYPFSLRVSGMVDGVSLLSLLPHKGPFVVDCEPVVGENEFRFRLPRQKDGSLLLELREKGAGADSPALETIPLGDYIIASGFDWTKVSLEDIYIGVDYARAGIRVKVNDWETVMQVTEEI